MNKYIALHLQRSYLCFTVAAPNMWLHHDMHQPHRVCNGPSSRLCIKHVHICTCVDVDLCILCAQATVYQDVMHPYQCIPEYACTLNDMLGKPLRSRQVGKSGDSGAGAHSHDCIVWRGAEHLSASTSVSILKQIRDSREPCQPFPTEESQSWSAGEKRKKCGR